MQINDTEKIVNVRNNVIYITENEVLTMTKYFHEGFRRDCTLSKTAYIFNTEQPG